MMENVSHEPLKKFDRNFVGYVLKWVLQSILDVLFTRRCVHKEEGERICYSKQQISYNIPLVSINRHNAWNLTINYGLIVQI